MAPDTLVRLGKVYYLNKLRRNLSQKIEYSDWPQLINSFLGKFELDFQKKHKVGILLDRPSDEHKQLKLSSDSQSL